MLRVLWSGLFLTNTIMKKAFSTAVIATLLVASSVWADEVNTTSVNDDDENEIHQEHREEREARRESREKDQEMRKEMR